MRIKMYITQTKQETLASVLFPISFPVGGSLIRLLRRFHYSSQLLTFFLLIVSHHGLVIIISALPYILNECVPII